MLRTVSILILSLVRIPAQAQALSGFYGAFAPVPVTARTAALGGTQTVIGSAQDAAVTNPALLAGCRTQASFHYFRLFGMIPALSAHVSGGWSASHGFGIMLNTQGDDLYRENTLSVGFGQHLTLSGVSLNTGMNMHLYAGQFGHENSDGSVHGDVWGAGIDLGLTVEISQTLVLGTLVKNVGNRLQWSSSSSGSYSESLPCQWWIGLGFLNPSVFSVGLDWEIGVYREVPDRVHLGLEKPVFKFLTLRSGFLWTETEPDASAYALGLGFSQPLPGNHELGLDMAYTIETLPNTLRVSVGWR